MKWTGPKFQILYHVFNTGLLSPIDLLSCVPISLLIYKNKSIINQLITILHKLCILGQTESFNSGVILFMGAIPLRIDPIYIYVAVSHEITIETSLAGCHL